MRKIFSWEGEMDLQQLAQQGFDAFNNRTVAQKAKELMDANVVCVDVPSGQQFKGPDAYAQYTQGFITAMPDITGTVIEHKVTGNKVVTRVRGQGTFTGTMQTPQGNVPGTGKKLDLEYQADADYNDAGKVTRIAFSYDMQMFMKQLGIG
jgi:predicted ester cyclase